MPTCVPAGWFSVVQLQRGPMSTRFLRRLASLGDNRIDILGDVSWWHSDDGSLDALLTLCFRHVRILVLVAGTAWKVFHRLCSTGLC